MPAAEETRCQKVGCGAAACTLVFQLRDHLERAQEHKAAKPSFFLDHGSLFHIASVSARAFAARKRPGNVRQCCKLLPLSPQLPIPLNGQSHKTAETKTSSCLRKSIASPAGNQIKTPSPLQLLSFAHHPCPELGRALCRPAARSPVVQRN